jgi:S-adenosylmethionine hydrolase
VRRPTITLLTDFGTSDHYVAAMKGVILDIAPDACLVDITHEIPPFAIAEAAFTLDQAVRTFPKGTVHLVVVDPGVGSSRRPIFSKSGGQFFVGPDNGVLSMVWERDPEHEVWEIPTGHPDSKPPASQTFHGRDIFAPLAAHLAGGALVSRLGTPIQDPVRIPAAQATETSPGSWAGTILKVDRYGNAITSFPSGLWDDISGKAFIIRILNHSVRTERTSYSAGKPGELFVIMGSTGYLEIAMREGNAATVCGARAGNSIELQIDE